MNHGVYFIESAGKIKIGYSSDLDKRFKQFANTLPEYQNLALLRGATKTDEWKLHSIFAASRLNGEWFAKCDALTRVIAVINNGFSVEHIAALALHSRERYPGELEILREAMDKADLELEELYAKSDTTIAE